MGLQQKIRFGTADLDRNERNNCSNNCLCKIHFQLLCPQNFLMDDDAASNQL